MSSSENQKTVDIEADELTDVAKKIIESIDRPKKSTLDERGPGGWLPKLDLPGFGEQGDDCGEEIPHFCDCCGDSFVIGRTCSKSRCPRCASSWVLKRAGTSREKGEDVPGHVARMDALARTMSSNSGGKSIKLHHLLLQPPMDSWFLEAEDPLQKTFHVIREILQAFGAEGYVYYHPWAGDNADSEEDDQGEWKKRLFNGRDWDDVRDDLIPRGHFHCIVAAEWIEGQETTTQIFEKTGWITKRIAKRDGSGKSLDGLDDLAQAVTYCLSHTGIDTSGKNNQSAYRAYGSTLDSLSYFPNTEAADAAVRRAAPRTLGIQTQKVACQVEVSPDEAADEDATPTHDHDHDGECSELEPDTDEEVDPVDLVPCNGKIRIITEAPRFLENPKWRGQARHSDVLQTTFEEFEGLPGS